MNTLTEGQSEYYLSDLQHMNVHSKALFSRSDDKENCSGVMAGQFSYQSHYGGLSVHGGRVTELQNLSHCFELQPGLSFNFVFEGSIDFALAGRRYRFEAEQGQQPLKCSAISLSQPEIMTRYMRKGMQICKLNLFVERSWLESRCNNSEDLLKLACFFRQHTLVTRWAPSKRIVALVKLLLVQQNNADLLDKLQGEHQAVELLSLCLSELSAHIDSPIKGEAALTPNITQYELKEKIDQCLQSCESLQAIASALSMSVSTLQRKFKSAFGITVIDYVRQRHLEIARSAMLHKGLSVGEAAYLAGYKYPSNFVTAFKKHFSLTPSEFIKSHS
jgi:AraC-like DNA-binding protein